MKTKLINNFIVLFLVIAIFFIIFQMYSVRNIAIASAKYEATRISLLVKDGLTSHMINGTMNKRDNFIDSITSIKEIKSLWIIRGDKVNKDYGNGSINEQPRDYIDRKVLKNGNTHYELHDNIFSSKSSLRVTIPYKATDGKIKCFNCHNVQHGDVLGAISIELDISHIKQIGKESLYLVLIATIILIFFIIIMANSILKPYLETFIRIGLSVKESVNGQFKKIIKPSGLIKGKEADTLVDEYNYFINELLNTFNSIENKLRNFTGQNFNTHNNSFLNTHIIINNLSDMYNFKKQIELDETTNDIYYRIGQILKNKFNINKFGFILYNNLDKTNSIILEENSTMQACNKLDDFSLCRAYKTSQDTYSIDNHDSCIYYKNTNDLYHYCISFKLMDNTTLIIKMLLDTKSKLETLKNNNIALIKKYLEEAIPTLRVKYAMNELNELVYKDGLTGLFNRKFLDEEMGMIIPLAKREKFNIAVLMLDMDHFKAVNDEHGHDVGDQVLKMFAHVVKSNIRESDIAIRMGGEEFLVLLINTNEENALLIADKLRRNIANTPVKLPNGENFFKTISTGISLYPKDSDNINQVIKNSDIALYVAKDGGRNKVVRWEDSQTSPIDIF